MSKIIGFIEMSKRVGKVVFIIDEAPNEKIIGKSCDKVFLYDEVSKKINRDSVGKNIDFVYGRGYNGNAFVSDVILK